MTKQTRPLTDKEKAEIKKQREILVKSGQIVKK